MLKNHDSIAHLFKVGTGLDSQILGDFEYWAVKKGFIALNNTKL